MLRGFSVALLLVAACALEDAPRLDHEIDFTQADPAQFEAETQRLLNAGVTPQGLLAHQSRQFEIEIQAFDAVTRRLEVLMKLPEVRARANKLWAEAQKELANARILHAAASVKEGVARQVNLDSAIIEGMQRYAVAKVRSLNKHHRRAVHIRKDGKLTPDRIRALASFFTEAAVGESRDTLLGTAIRDLRALSPNKFDGILDEEGRIVALSKDCFIPRQRVGRSETYAVTIPEAPPRNDGIWELHFVPRWKGPQYTAQVEIRLLDEDDLPGDWIVAKGTVNKTFTKRVRVLRDTLTLPADLPLGNELWVKLSGGARGDNRATVPLRPELYFVEADLEYGKKRSVSGEPKAKKRRLADPPPVARAFPGGSVMDLLRFTVHNEFDVRGEALDIFDHAFTATEKHARQSILDDITRMVEIRESILQFEKEVLGSRAGIVGGANQ